MVKYTKHYVTMTFLVRQVTLRKKSKFCKKIVIGLFLVVSCMYLCMI